MKNVFIRYDFYVCVAVLFICLSFVKISRQQNDYFKTDVRNTFWKAPDINGLPNTEQATFIRYGRSLIANTSFYLGPKGSVAAISNGLNCQNCHLEAGTKPNANNYAAVAISYPKWKDRSNRFETIAFRVNECMQRSLNGKPLDSNSREMKAMVAYISWLGQGVAADARLTAVANKHLPLLNRPADTANGRAIFTRKCTACHGENGSGRMNAGTTGYQYPPLWGGNSYNVSAGMYRLSKLASFIRYNMPYNVVSKDSLTDEEAWDAAAFINSQERTEKFFADDWRNLQAKPFDYPFGPYADRYSAQRHKYGPFTTMTISSN